MDDSAPRRQRRTASPKGSPRCALVAVVEPAALRLFRTVLEDSGFAIDAVDSGIDAVISARERCPDLILVDLQLRDVPGREAVGWLRSNPALRSTPIIILAGSDEKLDTAPILPGVLLRKPVSPMTIRRAIGNLFEETP